MDDPTTGAGAGAPDEAGFAPIEDLDPEPAARAGRVHLRERMVGVLLVCALAGLGLAQWWDQSGNLAHYQAGQRAAAAHDWVAAGAAYAAAAGYGDAGSRASEAGRLIAEHANQSQLAEAAAQGGDWPRALQAAQHALRIMPRDPAMVALAGAAGPRVYALALTGTVVLRLGATPPGLYVYGPGGWRLLPRSDSLSRVRGTCLDGDVLFDVRDPAAPATSPPPDSVRRGGGVGPGRQIVLAGRDGRLHRTLAFDPMQFLRYLCTESSVWGFRLGANVRGGQVASSSPALAVAGQPLGSPRVVTPALPGPTWSTVAVAADGRHILVLDSGSTGSRWTYRLGIAAPDGGNMRILRTGAGTVQAVDWSPDGQWLLLTIYQQAGSGLHKTIILAAADGREPDASLQESDLVPGQSDSWFNLPPTFIRTGPRSGQVLLAGRPSARLDHGPVALIDPAHPTLPTVTLDVSTSAYGARFIRQDHASGALLVGWLDSAPAGDTAATIAVVDTADRVQFLTAPLAASANLADAWLRDGRLVYAATSAEGTSGQRAYVVHSVPIASDAPTVAGTAIYTTTMAARSFGRVGGDGAQRFGPGLLAYVTPGNELHARTYDGSVDVLLEPGVGSLFDLDADITPSTARPGPIGAPIRSTP